MTIVQLEIVLSERFELGQHPQHRKVVRLMFYEEYLLLPLGKSSYSTICRLVQVGFYKVGSSLNDRVEVLSSGMSEDSIDLF